MLITGVSINLLLLGYFKYANFFVNNINEFFETGFHLENILLPLAISFFTFQQITYLVDSYKGKGKEYGFNNYCLFVTFFPQLIAGPIVHHREIMPQFENRDLYSLKTRNLSIGMTIFMLGLFKKVVLADSMAVPANEVFQAAENGVELTIFEAWVGALAYTFQLYFDFSGYSDMAIGLARMFGIILPINFYSPYKANNIIEFWRRWHITLSRFLRDYLYIPLGGNRKGELRRYSNLMLTMILGGLWHGAAWTFVWWGCLHGFYLCINHLWIRVKAKICDQHLKAAFPARCGGRILTFAAVVIAWALFRAESREGIDTMYAAMFGLNGISLPDYLAVYLQSIAGFISLPAVNYDGMFHNFIVTNDIKVLQNLILMLLLVWFFPNTLQYMHRESRL